MRLREQIASSLVIQYLARLAKIDVRSSVSAFTGACFKRLLFLGKKIKNVNPVFGAQLQKILTTRPAKASGTCRCARRYGKHGQQLVAWYRAKRQ